MTLLRLLNWILYLGAIALLALGAVWIAERPGSISLTWFGYRIELAIGTFLAFLAIALFLLFLLWRLLAFLWHMPGDYLAARTEKRKSKGYLVLARGLAAASGGNAHEARRLARNAAKLLGDAPLAHLLAAQAAQLAHDEDEAARHFTALAAAPETAILGLRGLAGQAGKRGDDRAALELAERALALHPESLWAADLVHRLGAKLGDFAAAERGIKALIRSGGLESAKAPRRSAALLAEKARRVLTSDAPGDRDKALADARAALKKAGDFAPARFILARLLLREEKRREAQRLIEQIWDDHPHDYLASIFLEALSDLAPLDRARRCEKLAAANPDHPATHRLAAASALAADLFGPARQHLTRLAEIENAGEGLGSHTALQFAALEEAEGRDLAKVRRWLDLAARALPDPLWICESCGEIGDAGPESGHWQLICRHCGAIDSLTWKRPRSLSAALGRAAGLAPAAEGDSQAILAPRPGSGTLSPESPAALSVDAARLIN